MSWPPLTREQSRLLDRLHKLGVTTESAARRMKLPYEQVDALLVELDAVQDYARAKRTRAQLEKSDRAFLAAFQSSRTARPQEESSPS